MVRFGVTAFLDLVCCGFGAAVLLFLVAANAAPAPHRSLAGRAVLIRCRDLKGAQGEVGIEYRRPGQAVWERADSRAWSASLFVAAKSDPATQAEALMVLFDPPAGTWQFRPFLVDFPRRNPSNKPVSVELEVSGPRARVMGRPGTARLRIPGDTGEPLSVRVRAGGPNL